MAEQRRLSLLMEHFFNRTDILLHKPPWGGKGCPVIPEPCGLESAILSHLAGGTVETMWKVFSTGKTGSQNRPLRLGTYGPGLDGKVVWGGYDIDGSNHARPILDPLATAHCLLAALSARGITAHPEKSNSGEGWHHWIFFDRPVQAAIVRRVLIAIKRDAGVPDSVEVFPKSDVLSGHRVGLGMWLPWWHGADQKSGCNMFHRLSADGSVQMYEPETFTTVEPELFVRIDAAIPRPEPKKADAPSGKFPEGAGGKPSIDAIIRQALTRLDEYGRHWTTVHFAEQMSANGYSLTDTQAAFPKLRESYPDKNHPYTDREAAGDLRDGHQRGQNKEPWPTAAASQRECRHLTLPSLIQEESNGDSDNLSEFSGLSLEALLGFTSEPSVELCQRSPAVRLGAAKNPLYVRWQRTACGSMACPSCLQRKAILRARRAAFKIAEAAAAGPPGWVIVNTSTPIPPSRRARKADALARKRAGAGAKTSGAFVCATADGGLDVTTALPAQSGLPRGYCALSVAGAFRHIGELVRALRPREPPPIEDQEPGQKRPPRGRELVGLRGLWRIISQEKKSGSWFYRGYVPVRNVRTILDALARHNLTAQRVEECPSWGLEVVWLVDALIPRDWTQADRAELENELEQAEDDVDRTATDVDSTTPKERTNEPRGTNT